MALIKRRFARLRQMGGEIQPSVTDGFTSARSFYKLLAPFKVIIFKSFQDEKIKAADMSLRLQNTLLY